MKKLLLIIAALVLTGTLAFAAEKQDEVHVSNLTELIYAMRSNRVIIIDNDIEFEDGLNKLHDFNPRRLPQESRYEKEKLSSVTDKCYIDQNTDGPELLLAGFTNLTIKSDDPGYRRLLRIRPRYAYVLNFFNCTDICIQGLVMGHTDEGYCDGGVLYFENCKNITILNCDLYGCGTEGIGCHQTSNLTMSNSLIRDCSYQIMTLRQCRDFSFDHCFFFRNREFSLLDIFSSSNIRFADCMITHNEGTLCNFQDDENILFERCSIMHEIVALGSYYDAKHKDCTISDAFGVKRH